MAKVILGNHMAVFAARSQRDLIHRFYCEVLGCRVNARSDEVDRFQLADVHIIFVYQDSALEESSFLRSMYLELKADDTEEIKRKILAFGVRRLELPDPHLYFQAPGGQVFRLVGMTEDLSVYERSSSATPGASATGS